MNTTNGPKTRGRTDHLETPAAPVLAKHNVPRTSLVTTLLDQDEIPVVALVAPTGYGKTTLITQWRERDARPFAWVHVEEADNNPARLLATIAVAVNNVSPVEAALLRSVAANRKQDPTKTAGLVASMAPPPGGGVLVLDNANVLSSPASRDLIAALAQAMPAGWQVVVAARGRPPVPIARLRANGHLLELTAADLAMDDKEAQALFAAAGLSLTRAAGTEINRMMDGWPAALYLAALGIRSGEAGADPTTSPRGTDRFIGDYLRAEVLGALPKDVMDFFVSTSLPPRVSGPLCDALLVTTGSADRLARLEELSGLVIPEDREHRWYRYHHVVREFLQEELRRHSPRTVQLLRRRAAAWYAENGMPAEAIDAAADLEDVETVLRLTSTWAQRFFQNGHMRSVERWLRWIEAHGVMGREASIGVTGALVHAVAGRAATAQRWIEAAEIAAADVTGDEAAEVHGALKVLHALTCPRDVEQMRSDAEAAIDLLPAGSPWLAGALVLKGIALVMLGEREQGDFVLQEGVEAANDSEAPVWATIGFAERALIARDSGHPVEADVLAERAWLVVADGNLQDYATSALAQVASAGTRLAHGDVDQARQRLLLAQRLRPQLTHSQPVLATQVWLEAARAYLAVTDVASARTMLREANDILWKRPHLDVLAAEAEDLRERANALRGNMAGASSLTAAELRLLPLLATYLSFKQIGERLFISVNTVKTEAISIYRKLGVSSRSETVDRAYDLGLLREPYIDDEDEFHPLGVR